MLSNRDEEDNIAIGDASEALIQNPYKCDFPVFSAVSAPSRENVFGLYRIS
jgi:hypothetical protein